MKALFTDENPMGERARFARWAKLALAETVSIRELHSRRAFAPAMSYGRHNGPHFGGSRAAAVLVALYLREGEWRIPLIRRSLSLPVHSGQIGLPGGRVEMGEEAAAAAVREFGEELGCSDECEIIGEMSPAYVFSSDHWIRPFVALLEGPPVFSPNPDEVADVLEITLDEVLNMKPSERKLISRGAWSMDAPIFRVGSEMAWGVTCVILGELSDRLKRHV